MIEIVMTPSGGVIKTFFNQKHSLKGFDYKTFLIDADFWFNLSRNQILAIAGDLNG